MKWFIEEAFAEYDIVPENIESYRNGFLVKTVNGCLLVKNVDASERKLSSVYNVKKHMMEKGYTNIERYIPATDGHLCIETPDANYVITELLPGRDCDFDNEKDMTIAAKALAEFHMASVGYILPDGNGLKNDLKKLPETYVKRLSDICKMKRNAEKGRSEFDKLFCEYAESFEYMGKEALDIITKSEYMNLCEEAVKTGTLCHNDYTHYNIRIDENGKTYVLNMENIGSDLRIYDVVNLIRRKMRKCNWSFEECEKIINAYDEVNELSKSEKIIAAAQLRFPQKFWRAANTFYNSKRGFAEKNNIKKLQEAIDETESMKKFLEKFETKYCY